MPSLDENAARAIVRQSGGIVIIIRAKSVKPAGSRRATMTRACAGLSAFGLMLAGTASAASAAAPSLTPEALIRAAAAHAVHEDAKASDEIATVLDLGRGVDTASPAGEVGATEIVADPDAVVMDVQEDAIGDSPQVPELAAALMMVPRSDPNYVLFYAYATSETRDSDFAAVSIDADGDGVTDFMTGTPTSLTASDGVVLSPIFAVQDGDLVQTGYDAGWARYDDGYASVLDKTELGLSSASFVFGLMDEMDNVDFAPDYFTGAPVPLNAPAAPTAVRASAGNGTATVTWEAPIDLAEAPASYTAVASPGGRSCTTNETRCTVSGLTNGTPYTFTVQATDAAGVTGPVSDASDLVTPRQPVVKVNVKTDSAKNKITVDVDPNKGSGFWTFKIQKRNAKGTWQTLTTSHKTSGSAETLTVDKPKGTYRVTVASKYGYAGTTSRAVTLKK
ncbi:fibronectin type III domain-containing protein [Actinoplanes regularis]|uniref:fibronectin type III domain-containing protein n=1 Tax=Actinoplanes regularis TaxID=52697 RepID=UPI0025522097|nr:fibronectin type III domain-containing protein [Actinoplanes regularis]